MQVPILIVRRETFRAIQVVLSEWPFLIVWIPKSCVRSEWALGDRGIVLEVVGFVAVELEQIQWKRMMSEEAQQAQEKRKRMKELATAHSAASQEPQA